MREAERGFTLVEMVVAVAIAAMLLAAGGVWMMSMRPGALRGATNDFDSALAAARQVAATSGNGATLAFIPRADHGIGYELRVYAGRPNATNAVVTTNLPAVSSSATVTEATLGSPPFAVFLSSAGYPTGKGAYPSIDAHGAVSFPVVAQQPPCPSGGIVLTFHAAQGATATRTLKCNFTVSSTAVPNASPTPNVPAIMPTAMVAHWTTDRGGALRFKVGEFGYAQAYTGDDGCSAITTWAQNPLTPSDLSNPDEPVAHFELYPVAGSPGTCTAGVSDAYGQAVHAAVQVMGDLTWENRVATPLTMKIGDTAVLTFGKTYDNEKLQLQYGGNCAGAVAITSGAASVASSVGATATTASVTITAVSPTPTCILEIGDQYGEPTVAIPILVRGKLHTLGTIHFSGGAVGKRTAFAKPQSLEERIAKAINGFFGGDNADASGTTTTCSYAQLYLDNGNADANAPNSTDQWNHTDASGCVQSGYPVRVWATENGASGAASLYNKTCGTNVSFGGSSMAYSTSGITAYPASATYGSCQFQVQSADQTVANGEAPTVTVIQDNAGTSASLIYTQGPCVFHPTNLTYSCTLTERLIVNGTCYASAGAKYVGSGTLNSQTATTPVTINPTPSGTAAWDSYFTSEIPAMEQDLSNAGGGGGTVGSYSSGYTDTGCP